MAANDVPETGDTRAGGEATVGSSPRELAVALLRQLARESGEDLVLVEGEERRWDWGWTFPFASRAALEGRALPFPAGPIAVLGHPARAVFAPSAVPAERLDGWASSQLRLVTGEVREDAGEDHLQ